jgi:hypothetical protein
MFPEDMIYDTGKLNASDDMRQAYDMLKRGEKKVCEYDRNQANMTRHMKNDD